MSDVVAIVPARAGSKGVPGKNVRELAGHPLVAWSIAAGAAAESVGRVVLSTDSAEIADIGRAYGADVPFLRPKELATDTAGDLEYLAHALGALEPAPSLLVLLRPTTPLRDPAVVDAAIRALVERPDATGLRSVHELPEPPQKMLGIDGGLLTGLFPDDPRPEYWNLPRQSFPTAYHPNGYVDVLRAETIRAGSVFGARVLAHVTDPVIEVDTRADFEHLEFAVSRGDHGILALLRHG